MIGDMHEVVVNQSVLSTYGHYITIILEDQHFHQVQQYIRVINNLVEIGEQTETIVTIDGNHKIVIIKKKKKKNK